MIGINLRRLQKLWTIKFFLMVSGLLFSILQVRFFGVGAEISAWFAAATVRQTIFSLIQSGRISAAFVPEYVRISNQHGKAAAISFSSALLTRLIVFALAISIGTILARNLLFGTIFRGLGEQTYSLAATLFCVLIWVVILDSAKCVLDSMLRAEDIFGMTETIGFVSSISGVVMLYFCFQFLGVWVMVAIAYLQALIGIGLMLWVCRRKQLMPQLRFRSSYLKKRWLLSIFLSLSTYVVSTQIMNLCLASTLSRFPDGFFSSFNYMKNAVTKIVGIFAQPIVSVGITQTSRIIREGKNPARSLKSTFGISVGIAVLMFFGYLLTANLAITHIWNITDPAIMKIMWELGLIVLVSSTIGLMFSVFRIYAYGKGRAASLYMAWSFFQLMAAIAVTAIPGTSSVWLLGAFLILLNTCTGCASLTVAVLSAGGAAKFAGLRRAH
jgi:peptidoglycan biosynthesis protein MviN/MurJ (putative lipid II flippase)